MQNQYHEWRDGFRLCDPERLMDKTVKYMCIYIYVYIGMCIYYSLLLMNCLLIALDTHMYMWI